MKNFKRSSPRERGGTYRERRGVLQGPHGGRNNQTGERGREGGERSRHVPQGRAGGRWISYHLHERPRNEWSRGQLSDRWKLGRWSCQADVARGHLIPPRVPGHMVRPRLIFRWPGDFWQCHCRRRAACNPKRPVARWETAVPRGLGPPCVPCTFPYVP